MITQICCLLCCFLILPLLSISPIVPLSSLNAFQPAHNAANDRLFPLLTQLVGSPYFRYVKIDLTKECPFWKDNSQCMNRDCNVVVMDEDEILHDAPFMYRNVNLGDLYLAPNPNSLVKDPFGNMMSSCSFPKDFCIPEDEHSSNGVYVDLMDNPERFTGYSGSSANMIWSAIYNENCFGVTAKTALSQAPSDICQEKRTFYKIISGLHASISIHICSQHLNKVSGKWERDDTCYWKRVGAFPDRVNNVYFVHALLLRAMAKLSPFLSTMDICTGNPKEDHQAKILLASITETASKTPGFDESLLFQGPGALALVDEVRTKFRNVSQIMDCVSCQKCRLWGKTQATGLGTALKVLFGINPKILSGELSAAGPVLSRHEVVALINTLNRFVESVHDIQIFNAHRRLVQLKQQDPTELHQHVTPSLSTEGPVISEETLGVWKIVASVLTAIPFVFGAIYGAKRSIPVGSSNEQSPTANSKYHSYSDSGLGDDSRSFEKHYNDIRVDGYLTDSSSSSGLSTGN